MESVITGCIYLVNTRNIHIGKIDHMTTSSHKTIVPEKFANKNLTRILIIALQKNTYNIHTTYKTSTPDVTKTKCYLPIGQ